MARKQTPNDFLKFIQGRPVVVKLNSGVDYRGLFSCLLHVLKFFSGILTCLDGYMNIALEQTEEFVNGEVRKTGEIAKQLAQEQVWRYIHPRQ
jgi:small nuclear ribonucleoprotein (snRNP)-like protein